MIRTRVGYSGGSTSNPTYQIIADHSETIQIDYDPLVINYEQLLDVFWDNHYPEYPSSATQYMSNIFYHNDEQKHLAERSKENREMLTGKTLFTKIRKFEEFYIAEMYHQKYYLKLNDQITEEMRRIYPNPYDLVNSTAAARINGFLSGSAEKVYVEVIIEDLGLSPKSIEIIKSRFDD